MTYTVRQLEQADLYAMQSEWDDLLGRSTADPLFMSWAWQASWWEVWSDELALELFLLAVYDENERLVGLAPMYAKSFRTPIGWQVNRLHMVGNAWKLGPTVRTEYVSFIVDTAHTVAVLEALAQHLAGSTWDELIIADADEQGMKAWEPALSKSLDISRLVRSESLGIVVATAGIFSDWVAALGKNTRLKLFNRRALFEDTFDGAFARWEDGESFLKTLNEFHLTRWGKPCFDDYAVDFHLKLLERLSFGQQAELSVLSAKGKAISVLYDIRAGNRVYNLQAGFCEHFHPKISLGTLHLGYAIERSFSDPRAASYDLLAGSGKNTFYKSHFKGEQVSFTTIEYVRSPVLKLAYRARGCLPSRMVSSVNRFFRL